VDVTLPTDGLFQPFDDASRSGDGLVLGVDVGTQGARVFAVDAAGAVVASARETWLGERQSDGWHDQEPAVWWDGVALALRRTAAALSATDRGRLLALAVASTSGTIVPVDGRGRPLRQAIMWDDRRATAEAEVVAAAGAELTSRLGYRFRPTFGLPKILWLRGHEPDVWSQSRWFLHAADWITGRLTGRWGISDWMNALKTGYDLLDERWPAFIERLGVSTERLPSVVAPGTPIGRLARDVAVDCGLPETLVVVAGLTDSNAAQFAAGAYRPGHWATTMGTGLAVKGVTTDLVIDPSGALYCHRHPSGWWLPGGASNVGGGAIDRRFGRASLPALDGRLNDKGASSVLVYPLCDRGDWFPFWADDATGFVVGTPRDETDLYRGYLEGVAMVERMAFDTIGQLGAQVAGPVMVTGGGTSSPRWLQIRADMLGREIAIPQVPEAALGAAIVAAGASVHDGLLAACAAMTRIVRTVEPQASRSEQYEGRYRQFLAELAARGYLDRWPSDRGPSANSPASSPVGRRLAPSRVRPRPDAAPASEPPHPDEVPGSD
jgi:xylulokinase